MAEQTLLVSIVTPQGFSIRVLASSVQVRTALGRIEILRNHAPLLATLKPGKLKVTPMGKQEASTFLYIEKSGVIEVFDNTVTVLADNSFYGSELDKQALVNSEKELRKKLAENSQEALGVTLDALNEVNEKLKIVDEIRNETL
tara:strand:- start:4878 stop:5309 length:432 start_codon:yes stop_codon:yes gene_type:complete